MTVTTPAKYRAGNIVDSVNWNTIPDEKDLEVWNRLTANFWLPEKVPVSNDIPSWGKMTAAEQTATLRVFTGLTMLDTIQGTMGAVSLIPHSSTPHEEAVYTNIAFMEAFAGNTELLTPHGWKQIKDITAEDTVAQYHPETNLLDFTAPAIVPSHFSNEVYEIAANNGNARQVVSGGHRVYLEEKTKKNNSCKTWTHSVHEARNLKDVNLNTAHRRFRSTGKAADGEGMTAIDRILVAINADGSYKAGSTPRHTGEKTGTIPCTFSLSKERKIDRLLNLANEAGWEITTRQPRGAAGNVKESYTFVLHVPVEYTHDRSKEFANLWALDKVSGTWAQEFVAESGLWDGHTLKDGRGTTFYSTSKSDADFFVAVASLAGYRTRMDVRVDDRSENYSDTYAVYASFTKDTVNAQSMQVTKSEPQKVYCVQVPSTFLLTRNGESPVISGNCVHAKSYSNIFMTLASTPEIDGAFRWSRENEWLQRKARIILDHYVAGDAQKVRVCSTFLESFLFYSGFYLPLRFAAHAKITNTADIIRLIIRDEAVHGYYIGYKHSQALQGMSAGEQEDHYKWARDLFDKLFENEVKYTREIYDEIGWTEDVLKFLKYNANKAFMNLGWEGIFPASETRASAEVMTSLDPSANETHDFFSGSGASYTIGTAEETSDDDWGW